MVSPGCLNQLRTMVLDVMGPDPPPWISMPSASVNSEALTVRGKIGNALSAMAMAADSKMPRRGLLERP